MAEKRRISNSPLANLRYRTRKEYRMMKGGSCSIETAEILCEYLWLELVAKKKTKVKNKWREKAPAVELCDQNKKAEAYSWKKQFVDIIDPFAHEVKKKMRWIMASVFKRKYTKVVDGKRVKKQSQCWYIKYRDADGIEPRVIWSDDNKTTLCRFSVPNHTISQASTDHFYA